MNGSECVSQQIAYWKEALAGVAGSNWSCRRTGRVRRSRVTGAVRFPFRLSGELHRKLQNVARDHEATLFMVVQAGIAALLSRLGAGTDIPLGSPVADARTRRWTN